MQSGTKETAEEQDGSWVTIIVQCIEYSRKGRTNSGDLLST